MLHIGAFAGMTAMTAMTGLTVKACWSSDPTPEGLLRPGR